MGEGGTELGLAVVILPHPPWRSCSREQQAAHLVQELQRGGEGAAPHRPAINHSYVARGQWVGRGQGTATAAHMGQGREARVRCGCKSSPKCFQVKANLGAMTEHSGPQPAPVGTLTLMCTKTHPDMFCIWSSACNGVIHTLGYTKTCAHQTNCCHVYLCSHTHTQRQL